MRLTVKNTSEYRVYAEFTRGVDGTECLNILTSDLKYPDELHLKLQLYLDQQERARLADFLQQSIS